MVNNNLNEINRLIEELNQELCAGWNWLGEKQQKEVSFLQVHAKTFLKIGDLKTEKEELEEKVKEKELVIEDQEEQIAAARLDAEVHLEALNIAEQWKFKQMAQKLIALNLVRNMTIEYNEKNYDIKTKDLENQISNKTSEIEEKTEKVEELSVIIEGKDEQISKLEQELQQAKKRIEEDSQIILDKDLQNENLEEENKKLQNQLYLTEKDLPTLPKEQSKFKQLKAKIKTKFHRLVRNKKHQAQELIAKIEVRNK